MIDATDALKSCLDALLRMIPDYCDQHRVDACTDEGQNAAIDAAGKVLYGDDRNAWPVGVRAAASGIYD